MKEEEARLWTDQDQAVMKILMERHERDRLIIEKLIKAITLERYRDDSRGDHADLAEDAYLGACQSAKAGGYSVPWELAWEGFDKMVKSMLREKELTQWYAEN